MTQAKEFRVLKLGRFTYIVQVKEAFADGWVGYDVLSDPRYEAYGQWLSGENQMKYCRTFTLSGARRVIRKAVNAFNKHKKKCLKEDELVQRFKKAEVVYQTKVEL